MVKNARVRRPLLGRERLRLLIQAEEREEVAPPAHDDLDTAE